MDDTGEPTILQSRPVNGWRLFALVVVPMCATVIVAMTAVDLASPPGVSSMIQFSVRLAVPWLYIAFAASSLVILWPGAPSRWLLRNRRHELAPTPLIEEFRPGLEALRGSFQDMLRGRAREQYEEIVASYLEQGVTEDIAARVAGNHLAYTALGIIQAAKESGAPLADSGRSV